MPIEIFNISVPSNVPDATEVVSLSLNEPSFIMLVCASSIVSSVKESIIAPVSTVTSASPVTSTVLLSKRVLELSAEAELLKLSIRDVKSSADSCFCSVKASFLSSGFTKTVSSFALSWSITSEVKTPEPIPSELIVPAIINPFKLNLVNTIIDKRYEKCSKFYNKFD